jgi:SAM-dependent methyltransferase
MKPIPNETFGLVLNLEALEHVAYPQKSIDEIHRILRPEGLLILTTVMHFRIHPSPKDYWRFTPDGIELLLRQFKILDCTVEESLKKPKGIWVTARKTGSPEDWGKLPPLRVVVSRDSFLRRTKKRLGNLTGGTKE